MATTFIDFQKLKEEVPIDRVIPMLGLQMRQSSGQFRGPCPSCGQGGDRALVITPAKGAFYCFAAKMGGDVIALVAHIREIGAKGAAQLIAEHNGTVPENGTGNSTSGTVPQSGSGQRDPGTRTLTPLAYLQAEHELVQALGVDAATAEQYGAGYAPKGILRGRLALPIHTLDGQLVGYCGIAVKDDQSPRLAFPNGFEHTHFLWNAHQVEPEDLLYVTREPLEALLAAQNGIENVVSFFGEITADALEVLRLLMDQKQIPHVEFM